MYFQFERAQVPSTMTGNRPTLKHIPMVAQNAVAVVQLPSHVQLFTTPWTAARQASLSLTISWSLPKFMFIASAQNTGGEKIL